MKLISIVGLISKILGNYVITTDDGTEYELSAIMPWESVSADHGTHEYTKNLGKHMRATGLTDGHTIWRAKLEPSE